MRSHRTASLPYRGFLLVVASVGLFATGASAAVVYNTGNHQYTNVNIDSDQHGFTILGEVDHTGIHVAFDGFGPSPFPAVELHGQHGVAFLEAYNPADLMHRITITAPPGYGFTAVDWKLDAMPPEDGLIQFTSLDAMGAVIPLASGTDTFVFQHDGENPFNADAHTDAGTFISVLQITSIATSGPSPVVVPIHTLKQVSLNLVPIPEPVSVSLVGLLLLLPRKRA